MRDGVSVRRRFWATTVGVVVGGVANLLTLLNYRADLTRTADPLGYASYFFDLQARSFMDGQLHVPTGSLGIEGFSVGGLEYMYFAPFPALLRIPILMTTQEFDGQLTILSMALAWVLLAVMTPRLTWLVRQHMSGDGPLGRFEAASWAVFLSLALGGTSATFNASLPWAYHEVYAWAVPLVIGSMYWMLRVLDSADPPSVMWLGVFCLATCLTRTTGGWAVCLATIGIAVWLLTGRLQSDRRRAGWGVLASGVVGLGAGITYNLVKFGHPYLFPLENQRWTAVNAHRREALEVNGGTITGPQFFETSLVTYFRPDGIRVVDYFPWITLPAEPARAYGGAFLDQSYRTGSVTSFMPLLLLLTVIAAVVVLRPGVSRPRRVLRVPLVAGVLVTGGVMGYGYLAYRYTCEFVPALVIGGAIGLAAVHNALAQRSRRTKAGALGLLATGAVLSIAANMSTGFAAAALTGDDRDLHRYLEIQQTLSWPGSGPRVTATPGPPNGGAADDLHIRGDCDELYVNTGDRYSRWQLVERRNLVIVAKLARRAQPLITPLATVETDDPGEILLQIDYRERARILIRNASGTYRGQWFDVPPPRTIRIGVGDLPAIGFADVTSTPGGHVGYVRSFEWDEDWYGRSVDIRAAITNSAELRESGLRLHTEPGLDLPLCNRIAENAGITW